MVNTGALRVDLGYDDKADCANHPMTLRNLASFTRVEAS